MYRDRARSSRRGGVRVMLAVLSIVGVAATMQAPAEAARMTGVVDVVARGLGAHGAITTGPDGNLWFPGRGGIVKMTQSGVVTGFTDPRIGSPAGITAGPDGAVWFADWGKNAIGRITTDGSVSMFSSPGMESPLAITTGPDGNLWFTQSHDIGRLTPSGTFTTYSRPGMPAPSGITTGPDGNLWFTSSSDDVIGRVTTGGVIDLFTDPLINGPWGISSGPDGNLWFGNSGTMPIGRITPNGIVAGFAAPGIDRVTDITPGPDHNLWFTGDHATVGRVTPTGAVTLFPGAPLDNPSWITSGPGGLWFMDAFDTAVGQITAAGAFTRFADPDLNGPTDMAADASGDLWFTNSIGDSIGRVNSYGAVATFRAPSIARPEGITAGPDGRMWFANTFGSSVGAIDANGAVSTFTGPGMAPIELTTGPDGNIWFTNAYESGIGRLTPTGGFSLFPTAQVGVSPLAIAPGSDGNLWFTSNEGVIGRVSPDGTMSFFSDPRLGQSHAITLGPDDNLWFADLGGVIGRITPGGEITTFTAEGIGSPRDIAVGLDGNLWFTSAGSAPVIGRITVAGAMTFYGQEAPLTEPSGIISGPDGSMWFTDSTGHLIARVGTGVPGRPGPPNAVAADGAAVVSWTPAPAEGDGPVSSYTVTASPGGQTCTQTTGSFQCTVFGLTNEQPYTFTIQARNGVGPGPTSSPSNSVTPVPAPARFRALTPTRVLDTRADGPQTGPYATPWGPGHKRDVSIHGAGGVPGSATAVALNVTVTNPTAPSHLTVWPAGKPQPLVSSLNWASGETVPNAVTVMLGDGGALSVFNSAGSADLLFDVVGYYAATGDGLTVDAQGRIFDSRSDGPPLGPYGTPWGANVTRDVDIGVAEGSNAVVLNITVTNTTASGYLTVWPAGEPMPLASSLNWTSGRTEANAVTVKLGTEGAVSIFNAAGSADVIIDFVGLFHPSYGVPFHPLTPERIQDSRPAGPQVGPYATPWSGTARTIAMRGVGGIPSDATAGLLNVTVTSTTAPSHLTVWGPAHGMPVASSLNWTAGETASNSVTATIDDSGHLAVTNSAGKTDVIIDTYGWYG